MSLLDVDFTSNRERYEGAGTQIEGALLGAAVADVLRAAVALEDHLLDRVVGVLEVARAQSGAGCSGRAGGLDEPPPQAAAVSTSNPSRRANGFLDRASLFICLSRLLDAARSNQGTVSAGARCARHPKELDAVRNGRDAFSGQFCDLDAHPYHERAVPRNT